MRILVKQVGHKSECHVDPHIDIFDRLVFSIPQQIKGQHTDVRISFADTAVVRAMSFVQKREIQSSDEVEDTDLNRERATAIMDEIVNHPAFRGGVLDFQLDIDI